MANSRLISRNLGSSQKFHRLHREYPLCDFAGELFMLLVVNADDFGFYMGDAHGVKFSVFPVSQHEVEDFESALEALSAVGLIKRYEVGGAQYLQIVNFDNEQKGIVHKRTKPRFPTPPGWIHPRDREPVLPGMSGKAPEVPEDSGKVTDPRRAPVIEFATRVWPRHRDLTITSDAKPKDWKAFDDMLKRTRNDPAVTTDYLMGSLVSFLTSQDQFYSRQDFGYWAAHVGTFKPVPISEEPTISSPTAHHKFDWTDCEICNGDGRLIVRTKAESVEGISPTDPVYPVYKLQDPRVVRQLDSSYPTPEWNQFEFRCSCHAGDAHTIPQDWPQYNAAKERGIQ